MEINVRYFTILRRITRKRMETIEMKEDSTIADMLALLSERYGDGFKRLLPPKKGRKGLQLVFLLNGQDVAKSNGLETVLHEGDTVVVMPPIAGG